MLEGGTERPKQALSRGWVLASAAIIAVVCLLAAAVAIASAQGHDSARHLGGPPGDAPSHERDMSGSALDSVRKRIELGTVTKYNTRTGIGCVRSEASDQFTACGHVLVPNGLEIKVGDPINGVVGIEPHEDNGAWSPRKVVLINYLVVHG